MQIRQNRRRFLTSTSLAAAAGVLSGRGSFAAEGPPETDTIRFRYVPAVCTAPQYVAEELLRAEGFTNVRYVKSQPGRLEKVAAGQADIGINFSGPILLQLDAGDPILVLAGVHPGCFELFATSGIRSVADLKGKTVGVWAMNSSAHVFLASIASYVGLDPQNDINWIATKLTTPATGVDETIPGLVLRDEDWYEVEVLPGQTLTMSIEFSHDSGDLNMQLYEQNETTAWPSNLLAGSYGFGNTETVTFTADGSIAKVVLRVYGERNSTNTYIMTDGWD